MAMNLNGLYIGEVVDNKDPEKLGRIKIRIPNVTGNIDTEDLPWAEPNFPYAYEKQSIFFIPEKDALVSVMFLNGSPYKPVYLGCIHRTKENTIPSQIKDDSYPNRKIIKTKAGYILFHDVEGKEYIEIKHKSGSNITFSTNGDIIIHAAKDIIMMSDNNILENPSSKYNVVPLKD